MHRWCARAPLIATGTYADVVRRNTWCSWLLFWQQGRPAFILSWAVGACCAMGGTVHRRCVRRAGRGRCHCRRRCCDVESGEGFGCIRACAAVSAIETNSRFKPAMGWIATLLVRCT